MRTKKDYEKAIEIVRSSFHRIDPYALLEGGAPDDEFDSEIQKIIAKYSEWNSAQDVTNSIVSVLNASFDGLFQGREFETEAQVVYTEFRSHGFL